MLPRPRFRVSGGFVLLTAWFALVNGWRLLAIVLSAAAVHEAGHWLVLRCLGGRAGGLQISTLGAVLETECVLSYAGELATVLAGPASNLLAAMVLTVLDRGSWSTAAGAQLVLCAFNLLPIRPLDGGRALELLVSWLAGPAAGEWAARCLGTATAAALAAFLAFLMWRGGGNLWLLPMLGACLYWGALPWIPGPWVFRRHRGS